MEQGSDIRIKFREWLIDQRLDPETAYGILESVPPYDWSLIARRDEMNERFDRVETRIDQFDAKLDRVASDLGGRIDGIGGRLDGFASLGAGMLFTAS